MSDIEVVPATPGTMDAVEQALTGGGDGASCQCQWWTLQAREFDRTSREEREDLLAAEVAASPPPGLIARVDGAAAGWVRVGPRIRQPRLARTRTFALSAEPWDDASVWAVTCFSIRKEFRGQGVMRALLDGAIGLARENGARTLEAYPFDPTMQKVPTNDLYLGVLSVFLDAGFREVGRSRPHRAVVSLDLSPARSDTVSG
ncbi:MAG: GNAT family N-acetyltransferase [Microbacterium sp.]|uniref:GNAT family N-acetyltransferase n=1 Tax=Microbacterium sp. TaxID=51671 RepID=UPI0026175ACC|nr:GNAT family N-acetyltransferase [Microbacterium sp.]MCX6502213.1 GNAT family N-acetyltransferase [Microbacterium sp.]